jgi:aerobic carbon-monoxide dehydrogenase medium subunit
MKAAPFDYMRANTIAEASAALDQSGVTTAAIAGGQSLLPMLGLRVASIDLLVDISRIEELKEITTTPSDLRIGALTTHAAIEDGKVPDLFGGLMRRVAGQISYRSVRNRGTIGGSVALADPAADWPGCLMAIGANVRFAGRNGLRSEPVAEFVLGPYSTSLAPGEIVLGFDVPRPDTPLRWGFAKVARKSGAFASSIAYVVSRRQGGPVSVVLAAAGPRACHFPTVAEHLQGGISSDDSLRQAIAADLTVYVPDADSYQKRLHTATILRATREWRTQ